MRIGIAVALISFSVSAYATAPLPLRGVNDIGETIVFDGVPGDVTVTAGGEKIEVFENQFNYVSYAGEPGTISFSTNGDSPLAGTTYRFKKILKKCRGQLYICETGCGRRTPRKMIEDDPGVCSSVLKIPGFLEACQPNNLKPKGVIVGIDVNLRQDPNVTSPAIARLQNETKVEVLKRQANCLEIDDELGEWVKIRTIDGTTSKEGWVFDAFIQYVDKYPGKL